MCRPFEMLASQRFSRESTAAWNGEIADSHTERPLLDPAPVTSAQLAKGR